MAGVTENSQRDTQSGNEVGRIPRVRCAWRNANLICFWPGLKPGSDMSVTRICQLLFSFSFKIPLKKKLQLGHMGTQGKKEFVYPLVKRVGEPAESQRWRLTVVVTKLAPSHREREWKSSPELPIIRMFLTLSHELYPKCLFSSWKCHGISLL